MTEAMLLLAVIAQRFRMRLVPSITLRPKNGVWVELEERAATRAAASAK